MILNKKMSVFILMIYHLMLSTDFYNQFLVDPFTVSVAILDGGGGAVVAKVAANLGEIVQLSSLITPRAIIYRILTKNYL